MYPKPHIALRRENMYIRAWSEVLHCRRVTWEMDDAHIAMPDMLQLKGIPWEGKLGLGVGCEELIDIPYEEGAG